MNSQPALLPVEIKMNGETHYVPCQLDGRILKAWCKVSSIDLLFRSPSYEEIRDWQTVVISSGDEFVTCAPEGTVS